MPFRVGCSAAQIEPVPYAFKLRRSREEIRYAQQVMGSGNSLFGDIDQVFAGDELVHRAHEGIRPDTANFQGAFASDTSGLSETASLASDRSVESNPRWKQLQQLTQNVCHPWDVVDYHLYLCGIEKGMDTYTRRNGMYVYDGLDCRPISYHELSNDEAFDPSNIGDDPKFLSWILPVSNGGSFFKGRSYVLGFDYMSRSLFVRQFQWIPDRTDDIWCVWDEGFTMYRLSIPDLIKVLDSVLAGTADVSRGVLSCHAHCMIPRTGDDPGLEIVITILLCQWVIDFAAVFSGMGTAACDKFTKTLNTYMEDCRLILQRASYRAWFASRDGYTMRDFSRKAAIDKYTTDLYTFSQSAECGSLDGKSWHAPGLNTCSMLRRRDRFLRRERTIWQLEGLFIRPSSASHAESSEQVFKRMLARHEENGQPFSKLKPPQTPSPRSFASRSAPRGSSEVRSPEGAPVVAEPPFIFDSPDFHKIPLVLLLERFLELVETYPGLDTPGIRRQFGALLAEIGIDIVECLRDAPPGSQNERRAYPDTCSFGDSHWASRRPRLLPSPLPD